MYIKDKNEVYNVVGITGNTNSGKTYLIKKLTQAHPDIHRIVTSTTRDIRLGEIDGDDYYFKIKENINYNDYFQITYQYENFYGTLYSELYQNNIVSLTPDGLRQYQLYENLRLAIIYLDCDIEICKQRVIKR